MDKGFYFEKNINGLYRESVKVEFSLGKRTRRYFFNKYSPVKTGHLQHIPYGIPALTDSLRPT